MFYDWLTDARCNTLRMTFFEWFVINQEVCNRTAEKCCVIYYVLNLMRRLRIYNEYWYDNNFCTSHRLLKALTSIRNALSPAMSPSEDVFSQVWWPKWKCSGLLLSVVTTFTTSGNTTVLRRGIGTWQFTCHLASGNAWILRILHTLHMKLLIELNGLPSAQCKGQCPFCYK